MPRKEITFSFVVDGKEVERLTDEHRKHLAHRISQTMSAYYTNHPEEYAILKSSAK